MSAAVGGATASAIERRRVAFLFLGETLLIPHLWPIVEALAAAAPELAIDLWISTATHEALLGSWSAGLPNVRLRRAPGFDPRAGSADGRNPPVPPKLPILLRLAPRLLSARVVVCAEQTSLWIPRLLPFFPPRFVKTAHGAGTVMARDDRRRRAAWATLVPSESERQALLARGFPADRVTATGYIKPAFRHRTPPAALFAEARPILLYTPHWQRERSSWWDWGRAIVAQLAAQTRWNVILAPHQRLVEMDPGVRGVLAGLAHLRHVHTDLDGFAMVDGSYTGAADLYLGDTSSQVVEYLATPRPCVFLNSQRIDWRATDDHGFWTCGDVVDALADLPAALDAAAARNGAYRATQVAFAFGQLGETAGAPHRAAERILRALD